MRAFPIDNDASNIITKWLFLVKYAVVSEIECVRELWEPIAGRSDA